LYTKGAGVWRDGLTASAIFTGCTAIRVDGYTALALVHVEARLRRFAVKPQSHETFETLCHFKYTNDACG